MTGRNPAAGHVNQHAAKGPVTPRQAKVNQRAQLAAELGELLDMGEPAVAVGPRWPTLQEIADHAEELANYFEKHYPNATPYGGEHGPLHGPFADIDVMFTYLDSLDDAASDVADDPAEWFPWLRAEADAAVAEGGEPVPWEQIKDELGL